MQGSWHVVCLTSWKFSEQLHFYYKNICETIFEKSNYFHFLLQKNIAAFFFLLKYIVGAEHSTPKRNIRKCLLERCLYTDKTVMQAYLFAVKMFSLWQKISLRTASNLYQYLQYIMESQFSKGRKTKSTMRGKSFHYIIFMSHMINPISSHYHSIPVLTIHYLAYHLSVAKVLVLGT